MDPFLSFQLKHAKISKKVKGRQRARSTGWVPLNLVLLCSLIAIWRLKVNIIVQPAKCYIDFEWSPIYFPSTPKWFPFFSTPVLARPSSLSCPVASWWRPRSMYPLVTLSLKKKITLQAKVGVISGAVKFTSSLSEIKIFVAEFIWLIISWLLLIHLGIVFSYFLIFLFIYLFIYLFIKLPVYI